MRWALYWARTGHGRHRVVARRAGGRWTYVVKVIR
jgi:hypothetical protein